MARSAMDAHDCAAGSGGNPLSGVGRPSSSGLLPAAETALMHAVLEDAIMCYLGRGRRRRIDPRILAREAEHWFRSEDWESPFSFNNICTVLGLQPDSARDRILGWSEPETSVPRTKRNDGSPRRDRIRALAERSGSVPAEA